MKTKLTFCVVLSAVLSIGLMTPTIAQEHHMNDSTTVEQTGKQKSTFIGGYGEVHYIMNTKRKTSTASLRRIVLFVGHRFSDKISLHTELEVENAFVAGGVESPEGEVAFEEAYLKFELNRPGNYIVAGLFAPRIGYINENHLPNTFNGVQRPFTEQLIIPTVWREIGIGLYGTFKNIPGLTYSLAVTNGLNSAGFENGTGIGGGTQDGFAQGLNLAVSGSLRYYYGNFRFQASGYIGGSTALEKRVSDSLQLNSGAFGNPVVLGEIDVEYTNKGWNARALATYVSIPEAANINRAFANNTPEAMYGAYAEVGYDLLYPQYHGAKSLIVFGRYEYIDLSARIPANGVQNEVNQKQYLVAGITYKPVRSVAIKADFVQRMTGTPNPDLIITPFPQQVPYYENNSFVNLGVAYSF